MWLISALPLVLALLVSPSACLDRAKVKRFEVDGKRFPGVDFDLGASYAGLIPVSPNASSNGSAAGDSLFFWYFPSSNDQAAANETLVWFNGGPGCSSLGGLLQENGPLTWQPGFPGPSPNPFGWQQLTNTLWIEYPVGTGYTTGTHLAKDEDDAAEQFLGFWKNFVDLFDLHEGEIYLSGESYAGMYIPYIASHMLDRKSTKYFNLQGTLLYDASLASNDIMKEVTAVDFMSQFPQLFGLTDSDVKHYQHQANSCGFTKYIKNGLQYPPKGPSPEPPRVSQDCELRTQILSQAQRSNPCFNVYDVRSRCPYLQGPLQKPGVAVLPSGQVDYFNRDDVKKALHVPTDSYWVPCVDNEDVFVNGIDLNQTANQYGPSTVLPGVVERSRRTIIAHGELDFDLIKTSTLLVLQGMNWGGKQGFSAAPSDDFYVPFSIAYERSFTGAGTMGVTRTERGLTFCSVKLSGHQVPQYQSGAAFRHVEVLLGRIGNLSSTEGFTAGEF